jgi:carbon-monoxide dehydrogenase large subunit
MAETRNVGQSLKRDEDRRFLLGEGQYTDDIHLPGTAYVVFIHSPHAHARIKRIVKDAARGMPGVLAVLSDEDWRAEKLGQIPTLHAVGYHDGRPMNLAGRPVFASGKACYVGDNVACVIGETLSQAMDAAEKVDVEYEPLQAVTDTAGALAVNAPLVHEEFATNEAQEWQVGDRGATTRAFDGAAHIVELDFAHPRITGNPLEPRTYLGQFDAARGIYTLFCAGQMPHWYRQWICRDVLYLPEHKVRIVAPDVGGGFGTKCYLYMEMAVVLWASRIVGRPIKWVPLRNETLATDSHARDHVTKTRMALDHDGRILAIEADTVAALGAYHNQFASGIACMFYPTTITGLYRTPSCFVRVRGVYSNTAPVDAYRGSGRPEAAYCNERLIENAARQIGLDPLELRKANFIRREEYPWKAPTGAIWDTGDPLGLHEKLCEISRYRALRTEQRELRQRGIRMGIGSAFFVEVAGSGPSRRHAEIKLWAAGYDSALVRVHTDGRVTIFAGSHSHGQGHDITFRQVAADALGIPIEDVALIEGDTDRVPFGSGTWGARSLSTAGMAIYEAGQRIIRKAKRLAAHLLEAAEADIAYEGGKFTALGTDRFIGFRDVAAMAYAGYDYPEGFELGLEETVFFDPVALNFPTAAHLAVVLVDESLGSVTLRDYFAVDDCGRLVNPMIVEGQVHGALTQGIGAALMEQVVYDRQSGQLLTGTFMDYAMPRASDLPSFVTAFQETLNPNNALGVKGGSEAGTIGPPAAIGNAIVDALWDLGVRHVAMPCTPEHVIDAIQNAQAHRA